MVRLEIMLLTNYSPKNHWYKEDLESNIPHCPVGWGCRIHRLHLCRGVRPPLNECPDVTLNSQMVRSQ